MNIQEFAALKVGDIVDNPLSQSRGTVTDASQRGVHVRWGVQAGNVVSFFYSAQGTIWFHWNRVEPMTAELAEDLSKRAT